MSRMCSELHLTSATSVVAVIHVLLGTVHANVAECRCPSLERAGGGVNELLQSLKLNEQVTDQTSRLTKRQIADVSAMFCAWRDGELH